MNNNVFNNSQDLNKLFSIFPLELQKVLATHPRKNEIIEIIIDLGKRAEIRLVDQSQYISKRNVSWQDLDFIVQRVGEFNDDNRAGIEKTLHRISCICNREGLIVGLTCRVGRSILGTISFIRDILRHEKSFLILGKPGVGKTTIIREMARVLSDEFNKRVIIIDTSNEIAGDSNIPHSSLGGARRMQVKKSKFQHNVMLEAVENHMPEVIIIDEISTELEVLAARTIAERGVQLIGTVHGTSLSNLIRNPILVELIGGIQYVTLSDDEAKRRGSLKTISERKNNSSFTTAIEVSERNLWVVHHDINQCMDLLLEEKLSNGEVRLQGLPNQLTVKSQQAFLSNQIYSKWSWRDESFIEKSKINTMKNLNFFKSSLVVRNQINFIIFEYDLKVQFLTNLIKLKLSSFTLSSTSKNLIIISEEYLKKNKHLEKFFKLNSSNVYIVYGSNLIDFKNIIKFMIYFTQEIGTFPS